MWAMVRGWLCRLKHRRARMHAATVILLPGCSGAVLPPVGDAWFSPCGLAAAALNPHHQQQQQQAQQTWEDEAAEQQQQERCRQKEPEPQGHNYQAQRHAQHQAQQPHQDQLTADQQQEGPEVAQKSRSKKRRRADLTPEALQAKFPGNARHYRVLALMQPALEAYERWVQACMQGPQGGLPWCSVQHERHSQQQQQQDQQQQPQVGQQQKQQQQQQMLQAEIQTPQQDQQRQYQGRQQQEQKHLGAPSSRGGAWQGQACDGDFRNDAVDQLSTVDWPSLYAMRYTLKPKVWLPGSCPEHCHTPWCGGRRQVAGEGSGVGSGDRAMPPATAWPLAATAVSCPPLPGATPCAMSLDARPSAEALPHALQHSPVPGCPLVAAATASGAAAGASNSAGAGIAAQAAGRATAEKATGGKATWGKAPVCMKLFGTLVNNPHGSEIWATCTVGVATASPLEFEPGCQTECMAPGAPFELRAPGGCDAVHGAAQGGSSVVRGAGRGCSRGGTWGVTGEGAAGGTGEGAAGGTGEGAAGGTGEGAAGGTGEGAAGGTAGSAERGAAGEGAAGCTAGSAERGARDGAVGGSNSTYSGTYGGTALPAPPASLAVAPDAAADSADVTLAAGAAAGALGAATLGVNSDSGADVAASAAAAALGAAALGTNTIYSNAGADVACNSADADTTHSRYSWPANGRLLQVLLPPGSTFLMSHGVGTLGPLLAAGRRFDLIVIDPPWENASAKRSKRYETMPSRELLRLPLPQLLSQQGLVAMWVTNRERIHRFLEQELLPHWGLTLFRTWLWVKVDRGSGQPLIPLTNMHRHCYEHLLLLTPSSTRAAATAAGGAEALAAGAGEAEADAEAAEGAAGGAAGAAAAAAAAAAGSAAASKAKAAAAAAAAQHGAGDASGWSCLPADGFTLFCTPGCHSRKPFLQPLLQQLLSRQRHEAHAAHAGHVGHASNAAHAAYEDLAGHAHASSSTQQHSHAQAPTAAMTTLLHAAPAAVHVATVPEATMAPSWTASGTAAAEVLDQDVSCHRPLAVMHDASQPQAATCARVLGFWGQGRPGHQLACLELFARELHEGWTSWGNEALLLQPQRVLAHALHE